MDDNLSAARKSGVPTFADRFARPTVIQAPRPAKSCRRRRLSDILGFPWVRDKRNESVPIQLAQCSFPGLAISSAKI